MNHEINLWLPDTAGDNMSTTMSEPAKKQKPKTDPPAKPEGKAPDAEKKHTHSYHYDQDVKDAIKAYREKYPLKLTMNAIIDLAVRRFLNAEGANIPEKPDDKD